MQPPDPKIPAYGPQIVTDPQLANSTLLEADRMPSHARDRVLRSANWFFWIAALSLINSVATHSGSHWHFILGLGITEVADAVAMQFGGSGVAVAVVFDVLAASVFAGFGLMARRMVLWPFVVG